MALLDVEGLHAHYGQAHVLQGVDLRIEPDTAWGRYPGGTTVTKGDPLFPRKTA